MRFLRISTALILLSLSACSDTDEPSRTASNPSDTASAKAMRPGSTAKVEVGVAVQSLAEIDSWIASQTGHIVVVDLWALW